VGAGTWRRIQKHNELHVMKYDQAMQSKDKEKWEKAVEDEHHMNGEAQCVSKLYQLKKSQKMQ
jgi:hypothetical protein